MTTTDNLGLSLPEGSDYADIETLNENFRTLDGQALSAQAAKDTPADADQVPLVDSEDDSKTKRVLWSAIKALFAAATHSHAWSAITDKPSSFTPSAHAATHKTGGSDPIAPADIDAATKPAIVTVTFPVAGWTQNDTTGCYEQTVAVAGLLTTDGKNIRVEPVGSTDADAQALTDAAFAMIDRVSCDTDGQLYARCPDGAPTVAFQAAVVISR